MNVLSLFNGCSGAYMALVDLGIKVDKYYISEIDKFANQAAKLIYPDSIFLGDITKWSEWDIDWSTIDLICAGSPCQGFSYAGKQLAFDDPRSALFFEFLYILDNCRYKNPDVYFFLENVDMKKEHMRVINKQLSLSGQCINSNLVSAQNRKRWYWTNISTRKVGLFGETETYIEPPKDRGILLKDIVEDEVDEKYYISYKHLNGLLAHAKKRSQEFKTHGDNGKAKCITVSHLKCNLDSNYICVAQRGRNIVDGKRQDYKGSPTEQRLEPNLEGKTNCITTVQKDNYVLEKGAFRFGRTEEAKQIRRENMKKGKDNVYCDGYRLRRLTPREAMKLQTVPERFQKILLESGISDSQIYKMMGNGWTIEAIKEYFKHIKQ
jgi:DNA-cytosine methyltransferase